jgi:hypothetical protein
VNLVATKTFTTQLLLPTEGFAGTRQIVRRQPNSPSEYFQSTSHQSALTSNPISISDGLGQPVLQSHRCRRTTLVTTVIMIAKESKFHR